MSDIFTPVDFPSTSDRYQGMKFVAPPTVAEYYWEKNKVDDLTPELKHIFFDMCVNQGRGTAVKILQRAINGKGGDLNYPT